MTLPHGWQELPLNRIVRMRSGDFISNDDIEPQGAHPVYGGNGFRGFTDHFNTVGPIVLVGRQGAHCGNVHVAHGQTWVSEHALRCFPEKELDAKWLAYALRDMNLNQYSVSAAQPGLSVDNLKHLRTAVPPLDTQRRIARFLDEKTARIDGLIEKKRALLDRLAEKRQALITRAVTKGLNPDAPMKPSGIDWLGDIPAHWEVLPLKRVLASSTYGISASLEPSGDVAVLRMGNLVDGELDFSDLRFLDGIAENLLLTENDVVFNRTNSLDLVGKASIFRRNPGFPVSLASYLVRFRFTARYVPEYANYVMGIQGLMALAHTLALPSIGQANLNPSRYALIEFPIPPTQEQLDIAAYLVDRTNGIHQVSTQVRHSMESLVEYRAALITATVTGQLAELR